MTTCPNFTQIKIEVALAELVALNASTESIPTEPSPEQQMIDNYATFAKYFNGHLTLFTVIVGEISNILAFAAFYSHSVPRPNIYIYLMALCIWDAFLLPSALLLYCIPIIRFGKSSIIGIYVNIIPFAYYLCTATLIGSLWMIVALCADRYMALCHPIRHRQIWKTEIRRVLMILSAVVLIYALPNFFEFRVQYCPDDEGNYIGLLQLSEMKMNPVYKLLYKIVGGLLFYSVCPFFLLLLLTLLIAFHLKVAARKRESMRMKSTVTMQRLQKDKTNNNNLLLSVIFKFMACHVLPTALDATEAYMGDQFRLYWFISYLVDVSNFLVVLNSSTNCFLYLYSSSTFRLDCMRVLQGHFCPRQVSALRAAAPAVRQTLRWNGAMVVKDEQLSFLPNEAPDLSRRRSAIPSLRSTYSIRSVVSTQPNSRCASPRSELRRSGRSLGPDTIPEDGTVIIPPPSSSPEENESVNGGSLMKLTESCSQNSLNARSGGKNGHLRSISFGIVGNTDNKSPSNSSRNTLSPPSVRIASGRSLPSRQSPPTIKVPELVLTSPNFALLTNNGRKYSPSRVIERSVSNTSVVPLSDVGTTKPNSLLLPSSTPLTSTTYKFHHSELLVNDV